MGFKAKTKIFLSLVLPLVFFCNPALAEDAVTLSITPPLFKVNMNPGESWSSVVKVINNNSYPVNVYAQVTDFRSGELGGVEFIKKTKDESFDNNSLSGWIEIGTEPFIIPAYGSQEMPFTINAPENASPGGHYSSILIGTMPPENPDSGSIVKVSSKLASLLLVRISGEVLEKGEVNEFSAKKSFNSKTTAEFTLRFENSGNVHLRPEGEVKITNIFGQTRGTIPINKKSDFGNVLPKSEKKWELNWKGDSSILDAGRLKADLLLSFGDEAKQSEVRTIYFWSFNLKPTLTVLGIVISLILVIVLLIRYYVRKSINQAKRQVESIARMPLQAETTVRANKPLVNNKNSKLVINMRNDFNDAGNRPANNLNWSSLKKTILFSIIVILAIFSFVVYKQYGNSKFFKKELKTVQIENSDEETVGTSTFSVAPPSEEPVATSTEIASSSPETATTSEALLNASSTPETATTSEEIATSTTQAAAKDGIKVNILNGNGVTGITTKAAKLLEAEGYKIGSKGNAENFNFSVTQIRYNESSAAVAQDISDILGAEKQLVEDEALRNEIIITLGKDFK